MSKLKKERAKSVQILSPTLVSFVLIAVAAIGAAQFTTSRSYSPFTNLLAAASKIWPLN